MDDSKNEMDQKDPYVTILDDYWLQNFVSGSTLSFFPPYVSVPQVNSMDNTSFPQYNSFSYPQYSNFIDDTLNNSNNRESIDIENKNEKHKLAERRRRAEIKYLMNQIRERLPEKFTLSNSTLTKKELLQATIQYIDELKQK